MNKTIFESYKNSHGKTWKKDGAYNLLRMLALFNKAYPDADPEVNKYWEYVLYNMLDPQDVICSQFGECPECGTFDILSEIGLDWFCSNPECEKKVRDWYDDYFKNKP